MSGETKDGHGQSGACALLHIYAQTQEHDNAHIVGTTDALTRLRDRIDDALSGAVDTVSIAFASDGEGYEVYISVEDNPHTWDILKMPYTDAEWSASSNESSMPPVDLLLKDLRSDVQRQWEEYRESVDG